MTVCNLLEYQHTWRQEPGLYGSEKLKGRTQIYSTAIGVTIQIDVPFCVRCFSWNRLEVSPVYKHFWDHFGPMYIALKPVDIVGNCQRLAFTVGVYQHMHKIAKNCENLS